MIFKKYYLINLAYTSLTMTKVDFNSFIEIWLTCNKLHVYKIHNLVCFNIYHMMSYDESITTSKTVNTSITLKVSFYPIAIYLPSLPPAPLPTIHLLSVAIYYHPFPGILYECIPLFGLASFTLNYFDMPPYYSMYQQFIPFYCSVVFHYMDIP